MLFGSAEYKCGTDCSPPIKQNLYVGAVEWRWSLTVKMPGVR